MKKILLRILIAIKNNYLLAMSVAIVIFFFTPLDFYYSNMDDVWYDVYNILNGVVLYTFYVFVTVATILSICEMLPRVGKLLHNIFEFLLFYLLVAFYIQGNCIAIPYGVLDGTPIKWADYRMEEISSAMAWIGILIVCSTIFLKKGYCVYKKITKYVATSLLLIAIFTLTVEFVFGKGSIEKIEKRSTVKNEWKYSENVNFNILIMDCLDSRIVVDMMEEDDDFNQMLNEFDGFTFFRDAMGGYNLTDYAVPLILTGEKYLGECTYGEYVDEAYEKSPILRRMEDDNWNVNIYTTITLPQGSASNRIDNVSRMRLKPIDDNKFIKDMYGTVAFRYMPTALKKYFYSFFFQVGANYRADYNKNEKSESAFEWNNIVWNNGYHENEIKIVNQNVFHLYHLNGIHAPRQYHLDYSFTTDVDEVNIEEGTKLVFDIVTDWIQTLKEQKLYDNSILVILGDHAIEEYNTECNYKQTPVVLIKGLDEHHEMYVSDVPISFDDFQDAYLDLLDKKQTDVLFEKVKKEIQQEDCDFALTKSEWLSRNVKNNFSPVGRNRYFYYVFLMNEMRTDSVGGPFWEFETEYPAYLGDKMSYTGVKY